MIIRIILSVALLVMVYRETGPWTTVAVALLGVASELAALAMRKVVRSLKEITHILRSRR